MGRAEGGEEKVKPPVETASNPVERKSGEEQKKKVDGRLRRNSLSLSLPLFGNSSGSSLRKRKGGQDFETSSSSRN